MDDGYADELPQVAERLRQDRARAVVIAGIVAEQEAAGVRVLGAEDDYTSLSRLTDAADDADERPALDADAHTTCGGHAVIVQPWGEHDVVPVCTTPDAHQPRHRAYGYGTHERAVETEEEQAARKEAEKAARRELIANNKAWDAADTLRTEFVTTLLQRKALPKGWHLFAAVAATRYGIVVRNDMSAGVRTLLGVDPENGYRTTGVGDWVEQHPTKAGHVTLAFFLSAFEHAADRAWWRYRSAEGAFYLTTLQGWGYRLSEVERIVTGDTDAGVETD